jgi:hypothetical protein
MAQVDGSDAHGVIAGDRLIARVSPPGAVLTVVAATVGRSPLAQRRAGTSSPGRPGHGTGVPAGLQVLAEPCSRRRPAQRWRAALARTIPRGVECEHRLHGAAWMLSGNSVAIVVLAIPRRPALAHCRSGAGEALPSRRGHLGPDPRRCNIRRRLPCPGSWWGRIAARSLGLGGSPGPAGQPARTEEVLQGQRAPSPASRCSWSSS